VLHQLSGTDVTGLSSPSQGLLSDLPFFNKERTPPGDVSH